MITPTPAVRPPLSDAAAWPVLAPLLAPFLPWSSGAMRPSGLLTVLGEVWFRAAPNVLELGSGVSTLVVARLLRELGAGSLVAVEHDPMWAGRIGAQLRREGLNDVASVTLAPLRPHPESWDGTGWYDETLLAGGAVDVLVVDGPPAWQPGFAHARYPALGALAPRLTPGAAIVVDDVERAGEQDLLARWTHEHGVAFLLRPEAGDGVA